MYSKLGRLCGSTGRAGGAEEWGWVWCAPGTDGPGLVLEGAWMLQDSADPSRLFFSFFSFGFFFFTKMFQAMR